MVNLDPTMIIVSLVREKFVHKFSNYHCRNEDLRILLIEFNRCWSIGIFSFERRSCAQLARDTSVRRRR